MCESAAGDMEVLHQVNDTEEEAEEEEAPTACFIKSVLRRQHDTPLGLTTTSKPQGNWRSR